MDIIRYFLASGLFLWLIWTAALVIGAWPQLRQAQKNWIEDTNAAIHPNAMLTKVLNILGLSAQDRLTCTINIYNALMLWPLTLIFGYPLIKAFRLKETRLLDKGPASQSELSFITSDTSTQLSNERSQILQKVPG